MARHNVDFLQTKQLLAIEETTKLDATNLDAVSSLPNTAFEETRGDLAFNGGKGYLVTNMYEMGIDDVVTMVLLDEKNRTIVYAWAPDEVPKGVDTVKLGSKMESVSFDETGVTFTEDFLLSFMEVKKNGEWYDFDKPTFVKRVLSFFDAS
ncbi:unnamed protein product [Cuscuta epithymum]|uniref:Uncharacterized protein n=1 Tax=Cuscuta epithymum TaxID=186058 RepID=A0AAV0FNB2_9ASTE|nr:unnamed protein product [Cuscuta epithymum]